MLSLGSSNLGASAGEPYTRSFLLRVLTAFNSNHAQNRDALVYERCDAKSRAVISKAWYVQRHTLYRTAPGTALVEGATPIAGGYWTVHHEISGTRLTDYWHYVEGHWRFNLPRSKPAAVRVYCL